MQIVSLLCLALSSIQIDGSFTDWPDGVTHQEDTHFEYAMVELPSQACLQQLPHQKVLTLGQYTIYFSPKGKGYGISCKKDGQWISPYEAGVVFAPTTASTKFEIRVNKPSPAPVDREFDFTPRGDIRVVSWNVEFGNLLEDKERGARILKALQPDVLLLQELDGEDTTEQLSGFLQSSIGGTWNVITSEVHGTKRHHQLKSAIATKYPTKHVPIENVSVLKAVLATLETQQTPIHVVSLHLRCCGGPKSEAEEQRQEEATVVRQMLDSIQHRNFIVAGDWNLVGTTKPLDILREDKLEIVDAFQPDGMLNATWSDATSSFTPGRLDWMLYSPETFKVINCFVLDSADLGTETLIANDLLPQDTAELSDHLPLVADFEIIDK